MHYLEGTFRETRTRRGLMNKAYSIRALGVLKNNRAFRWLCSTEEAINRGDGELRFSILAELGRVDDEKTLRAFAREICKRKPRAKVAVALIRRWRTGKDCPGGAISLTDALIRCVNDYLATHPATTWQMVRAALTNTLDAVEKSAE
jgi:hypothetical protein